MDSIVPRPNPHTRRRWLRFLCIFPIACSTAYPEPKARFDLVNVDIASAAQAVQSFSNRSVLLEAGVGGLVTLRSSGPVDSLGAMVLLAEAALAQGFTPDLDPQGRLTISAATGTTERIAAVKGPVVGLYRYRHISSPEAIRVLLPLMSPSGSISAMNDHALMLIDETQVQRRTEMVLALIDTPRPLSPSASVAPALRANSATRTGSSTAPHIPPEVSAVEKQIDDEGDRKIRPWLRISICSEHAVLQCSSCEQSSAPSDMRQLWVEEGAIGTLTLPWGLLSVQPLAARGGLIQLRLALEPGHEFADTLGEGKARSNRTAEVALVVRDNMLVELPLDSAPYSLLEMSHPLYLCATVLKASDADAPVRLRMALSLAP